MSPVFDTPVFARAPRVISVPFEESSPLSTVFKNFEGIIFRNAGKGPFQSQLK